MAEPKADEGFVAAHEGGGPGDPDEDIDLAAEPGTPEFDRAQEEVMIRGAADAATETEGIADVGIGNDESEP